MRSPGANLRTAAALTILGLAAASCKTELARTTAPRSASMIQQVDAKTPNNGAGLSNAQRHLPSNPNVTVAEPSNNTTDHGPAWVEPGGFEAPTLVYSANGRWYAALMAGGVLLGDSTTGMPVAFAPVEFDKTVGLAFHPSSDYLLTIFDFQVTLWTIEVKDGKVALKYPTALPAPVPPGLIPPVFDREGRTLVVFDDTGAVVYDFARKKPLEHVYSGFSSSMGAAGFSGDSLYFVQPTTGPCDCDDYKGSDAGISVFRLGSRTVQRPAVWGDLNMPLSMRQAKIATRDGLWDAHTGRRLARWTKGNRVIGVFRLRQRGASILTTNTGNDQVLLEIVSYDGKRRPIMQFPELIGEISVRPQDDIIHFFGGDPDALLLHRVDIDQGKDTPVTLLKRLCVNDGAVLSASACPTSGPMLRRQKLPETAELPENLLAISPPPPNENESARPKRRGRFEVDPD